MFAGDSPRQVWDPEHLQLAVDAAHVSLWAWNLADEVLTGGISALAASRSGGSTIFVASAGQASIPSSHATQSADISQTIAIRQSAAVRVFVARDLDFRRAGPAR